MAVLTARVKQCVAPGALFPLAGWTASTLFARDWKRGGGAVPAGVMGVQMSAAPMLTILTVIPLAGGLAILVAGNRGAKLARGMALGFAGAALAMAALLWTQFDAAAGMQFEERAAWLPALGIEYHLGIDGLALPMLLLSALVVAFAIAASRDIGTPLYYALLLFVEAGLFGVFTALNFIHWFLFWELSLVPASFLCVLADGPPRTRRRCNSLFTR